MGRRSRRSKRKMNSMILALLLSAVMLIMSTYAWFSANRTVSIEGITAKVSAAEGLQISLDAKTWSSSVTVNATELAKATGYNDYVLPEELHPVSTIGETASGEIKFFDGQVSADGTKLTGAATATAPGKFIVFDVYLKNSSSKDFDDLQLAPNTEVKLGATEGKLGVANTGLENSVRVGFSLYPNTATFTAAQADIAAITGNPAVSIWEPNFDQHIGEVTTNDSRVGGATGDPEFVTLGLKAVPSTTLDGINGTTGNTFMESTSTIRTGAKITTDTKLKSTSNAQLKLPGNTISKLRVYIWLEGQDPDCIDTASTGKYLDFVLNLSKPGLTTTTSS